MRIRRMARLLASNLQDYAPPLQQLENDTMRDENQRQVVDETTAMGDDGTKAIGDIVRQDDAPPKQHTMGDEKQKQLVVDETIAMEDHHREAKPTGDVVRQDDAPPQQMDKETMGDEKQKQVVDETIAIEDDHTEAKPIGDVVRVSGDGMTKRNHFASFEYDGIHYHIEDTAMFSADQEDKKPYVAIIKDITQTRDGSMMVTVQWFYRPEDTQKRGGGNWESSDTRELFYSFHLDEISVESVIHKCVVHFIPSDKQIPYRKQHPGFIVQKVYDTERKRLFKFTDRVYTRTKREEIDLLIQKTMSRIGELPDIEKKDQLKRKRSLLRKK